MKYRSDIDGIRAIAVLLVLFYHAHFSLIQSGFIGVDVFFVISGFLITNIIVGEIRATHKFRLINFYKKRLWRLMPVLIMLIFVTTVICYGFYLPTDLIDFTESAKSTALFQSNRFFSNIVGGYFSPNVNTLPLLHTWSLSIEWQWYIILPFLLLGLTKVFQKSYFIYSIVLLWVFTFILAIWLSYEEPTRNYYFLTTRIFELLTGSVVAILPLNHLYLLLQQKVSPASSAEKHSNLMRYCLNLVGMAALFTLFAIALKQDVLIGFPNYYALIVCLATAVLIGIGQVNAHNVVTRFLSFKPLVGIGLISYSLYIWHWPIFATLRYLSIEESLDITIVCLLLSLILGIGSWYFLERPARKFNHTNIFLTVLILLVVPIVVTQWIGTRVVKRQGFPQRFHDITINISQVISEYVSEGRSKCMSSPRVLHNPVVPDNDPICQLGMPDAPNKALMIGDSFANHYWGFMDILAKDAQLQVRSNTTAACLALPGIYVIEHATQRAYLECKENTERYYQDIAKMHYDYVILGQKWTGYFDDRIVNDMKDERSKALSLERIEKALDEAIQLIVNSGARPVILDESFIDPKNGDNQCFYKSVKLHRRLPSDCGIAQQEGGNDKLVPALLEKMQQKYPNLIVIDPKNVQCLDGVCPAEIQGIPMYAIQSHFWDFSSYKIGESYLKIKGNPLNP